MIRSLTLFPLNPVKSKKKGLLSTCVMQNHAQRLPPSTHIKPRNREPSPANKKQEHNPTPASRSPSQSRTTTSQLPNRMHQVPPHTGLCPSPDALEQPTRHTQAGGGYIEGPDRTRTSPCVHPLFSHGCRFVRPARPLRFVPPCATTPHHISHSYSKRNTNALQINISLSHMHTKAFPSRNRYPLGRCYGVCLIMSIANC
jgi:hypothetical protein